MPEGQGSPGDVVSDLASHTEVFDSWGNWSFNNNPILGSSQAIPIRFSGCTAPSSVPVHLSPQAGITSAYHQLAAKGIQWRNAGVQPGTATTSITQRGHLQISNIRKRVKKTFRNLNITPAFHPVLIFPS